MSHLLIFGPGYSASRIAQRIKTDGWHVSVVTRSTIDDANMVRRLVAGATHILSSVPPDGADDPVLSRYADLIARAGVKWVGYLSSTGVYGNSNGAWIDESAAVAGRRAARNAADLAWQAVHPQSRVFRLPGIYGPGRSALDRLRAGRAHRVDVPGQIFSRIHVEDLAGGVIASFSDGPPGVYNLADDLPAAQNDVIAFAARLAGLAPPPIVPLNSPDITPEMRAFYGEVRRIANGKAQRLLGWRPAYPDYRAGLRACLG